MFNSGLQIKGDALHIYRHLATSNPCQIFHGTSMMLDEATVVLAGTGCNVAAGPKIGILYSEERLMPTTRSFAKLVTRRGNMNFSKAAASVFLSTCGR